MAAAAGLLGQPTVENVTKLLQDALQHEAETKRLLEVYERAAKDAAADGEERERHSVDALKAERAALLADVKAKKEDLKLARKRWADELKDNAAQLAALRDELLQLQAQKAFNRALANNVQLPPRTPESTRAYLEDKKSGAAVGKPDERSEVVEGTIEGLTKALDRSQGAEASVLDAANKALQSYATEAPRTGVAPEVLGAAMVLSASDPSLRPESREYADSTGTDGDLQAQVTALRGASCAADAEQAALGQLHNTAKKYMGNENERLSDAVNTAKKDLQRMSSGLDADRNQSRDAEAKAAKDLLTALKLVGEDGTQAERDLDSRAHSLEQDKAQLERDLDDLRAQLEAERKRAQHQQDDADRLLKEERDALRAEVDNLKAKNGRLESELAAARADSDAERDRLVKENRDLKRKLADAENDMESLRADLAKALADLKRLKQKIDADDLEGQLSRAQSRLRDAEAKNRNLDAEVEDLKEQVRLLNSRPKPTIDDGAVKDLERQLGEARQALYDAESTVMDTQGELDAAKRKNLSLQADLRRQQGLVDDFKARAAEQAAERQELANAKIKALAAARRAEAAAQDLDEDLQEQKTLSDILEAKVIELVNKLNAQGPINSADPSELEEMVAETKRLRGLLAKAEAAAREAQRELENDTRPAELQEQIRILEHRIDELEQERRNTLPKLRERLTQEEMEVTRLTRLNAKLEHLSQGGSNLHELQAQESQIRSLEDALTEANAKIDHLKSMIQVMEVGNKSKPLNKVKKGGRVTVSPRGLRTFDEDEGKRGGRVTVSPRGLGAFDEEDTEDDSEDGFSDTVSVGPLDKEAYMKRIEALRSQLHAEEIRASHAESELARIRSGDGREIEMLREHAQREADRLLSINNELRAQLHQKQKVSDAKVVLKIGLLTSENARLKKALADVSSRDHDVEESRTTKVPKTKRRGHAVRAVKTRDAKVQPRRTQYVAERGLDEDWISVHASAWETAPANALGISKEDVILQVGGGRLSVLRRADDTEVLECPIRDTYIKRIGLQKNVVIVELSDDAGEAEGRLYFTCLKAPKVIRALEREMYQIPRDTVEIVDE